MLALFRVHAHKIEVLFQNKLWQPTGVQTVWCEIWIDTKLKMLCVCMCLRGKGNLPKNHGGPA